MQATDAETLAAVDGIDADTVQAIFDWLSASNEGESQPAAEEEAAAAPGLNDDAFMAALSKALKESEQSSGPTEDPFEGMAGELEESEQD